MDPATLQQFVSEQVAQRPVEATLYTQGQNIGQQPIAPVVGVPVQAIPAAEEDPLAKLISLVKGDESVKLKIKELFVVSRNKISNMALGLLVEKSQDNGMPPEETIKLLLTLDKMVESGELDQAFFEEVANGTGS